MRSIGGASALAVLSLITTVIADATTNPQACPYIPEWNPCRGEGTKNAECATIQVPKNWYNKGQGDIVLRLIRDPVRDADGKVIEDANSIFYNPGGPGGSGIESVLTQSNAKGGSRLKKITGNKFHIVSFDNRGVALNEGYKCPSPEDLKRGRAGTYEDEDLEKEIAFYKQKALDCDAYSKQNSDIGRRINTPFVARDIRQLSKAMNKDGLIRYYGASYGTVLGDTIAKLFPKEIAKMTMDGNINPNDYYQDQLQNEEVSDIDDAIGAFFDRCALATEDKCAWKTPATQTRTKDTLLKKFGDWVGADPTATDRGRVNSPLEYTAGTATENLEETNWRSYTVRSLFRDVLRNPDNFPKLATVLQYWYDNPSKIASIDIEKYEVPSKKRDTADNTDDSTFVFTDNNYDPTTAEAAEKATVNELEGITCSENTYRKSNPTVEDYRDILDSYLSTSKYAGDAGTGIIFPCYQWITTSAEPALSRFADIETSNPILFVQTTFDPVTPSRSGKAARNAFTKDSASIILSTGFGHCSSQDPSELMDAAILAYWRDDKLPVDGTTFPATNPNPFLDPPEKDTTVNDGTNPDGNDVNTSNPDQTTKRDLSYLFAGLPSQPVRRGYTFPRRRDPELVVVEICDLNSTDTNSTSTQTTSTATTGIFTNSTTATSTGVSTTSTGSGTTITVTGSSTTITFVIGTKTTVITEAGPTTLTFTGPVTNLTGFPFTFGTPSTISGTASGSPSRTTGKITVSTGTNTYDGYGSAKPTTKLASWGSWDPAKSSTKPVSSWSQWDPSQPKTTTPATWQQWSGQSGSVPITKTVCGKDNKDCKTTVVAVPTTTVYVDYVQDVCSTGVYTNTITVTATCNKGCDSKPTGIPQGYTTTAVYCSVCAPASTVTVTVKVSTGSAGPKATQEAWSDVSPAAASTGKASSVAAQYTQDPWQAVSSIAAQASQSYGNQASWTGVAATGVNWNTWSASPTAPNVAKYTGAASKNMASGGVFAAFAAGLLLL